MDGAVPVELVGPSADVLGISPVLLGGGAAAACCAWSDAISAGSGGAVVPAVLVRPLGIIGPIPVTAPPGTLPATATPPPGVVAALGMMGGGGACVGGAATWVAVVGGTNGAVAGDAVGIGAAGGTAPVLVGVIGGGAAAGAGAAGVEVLPAKLLGVGEPTGAICVGGDVPGANWALAPAIALGLYVLGAAWVVGIPLLTPGVVAVAGVCAGWMIPGEETGLVTGSPVIGFFIGGRVPTVGRPLEVGSPVPAGLAIGAAVPALAVVWGGAAGDPVGGSTGFGAGAWGVVAALPIVSNI